MFESVYFRGMVNTTYFPTGNFFAQLGLSALGWAFVNLITLRKSDPFTSGNDSYDAFKKLAWIVPIVFFYSTINTQRSPQDLNGYCSLTHGVIPSQTQVGYLIS